MKFHLTHKTEYKYELPAAEAYLEARLHPPDLPTQQIRAFKLDITPAIKTSQYVDHNGNRVDFLSIPFRHNKLVVKTSFNATTSPLVMPEESLDVRVSEAVQIVSSKIHQVYHYLKFTPVVTSSRMASEWAGQYFHGKASLREALLEFNTAIYKNFRYQSGSTTNSTPLQTVWKSRTGVCQDFAHIALSVLRHARLPARYVCGYIETNTPTSSSGLVGSIATHAWVEVLLPGMHWFPLDPTNNQVCGERHVTMAYGADFSEATPLRGTFKGVGDRTMKVAVRMRRLKI